MRLKPEFFDSFPAGVVSTAPADQLPLSAAAWAKDSALYDTVAGKCLMGKRKGARRENTAAVSAGAVTGQARLTHSNGTHYRLLLSDLSPSGGRVDLLAADGSASTVSATAFTASGPYHTTVANDMVFVATDRKKLRLSGSSWVVEGWGMAAPAAPTAADQGAGDMAGDYDFALTYENGAGNQSSRGATLTHTAGAGKIVRVSWSAPADTQVTYVRVHARKPSITNTFVQVARIAVATGLVDLNIADADWSTLITLSPDTVQYGVPPTGIKASAYHLGRMFVVDKGTLYWSSKTNLEGFDPEDAEPIGKGDGQDCTGLLPVKDNLLLIFKDRSVWGLQGTEPANWAFDRILDDVGCTSPFGARSAGGKVLFWSALGPVDWTIGGECKLVGQDYLGGTINPETLATGRYSSVCAGLDRNRQRVVWACSSLGSSRNDLLIPYRYSLGVFESSGWDLLDCASLCEGLDTNGVEWLYLGNYSGRCFEIGSQKLDGPPAGLTTYTGVPTGGSSTTLTDTEAAWPTTAGLTLADTFVCLISQDGTVQRRRITSNTATELTVGVAWDSVPSASAVYVLSSPVFQLDTGWQHNDAPFYRKRLMNAYLAALANGHNASATLQVFGALWATRPVRSLTFTVSSTGGAFDVSNWDESYWGGEGVTQGEQRVGKVGTAWKLRIQQWDPGTQFLLIRMGLQANLLSSKEQ